MSMKTYEELKKASDKLKRAKRECNKMMRIQREVKSILKDKYDEKVKHYKDMILIVDENKSNNNYLQTAFELIEFGNDSDTQKALFYCAAIDLITAPPTPIPNN